MVVVSYSGKEINAKLVYYGPGLCGKTTNLEYIYQSVPQNSRGKMVSMKTRTERTLFFDFLPVDLGQLGGFKTRFLLYTVPGQVYYNATRKLVLRGVDAVVFVADSQRGKMKENLESLQNLRDNLKDYELNLDDLPWVIQYNKRDLPDIHSVEELEQELNTTGVPYYEAVATTGDGVFECFRGIGKLMLQKLSREVKLDAKPSPSARLQAAQAQIQASRAQAGLEPAAPAAPAPAPAREDRPAAPPVFGAAGTAGMSGEFRLPPAPPGETRAPAPRAESPSREIRLDQPGAEPGFNEIHLEDGPASSAPTGGSAASPPAPPSDPYGFRSGDFGSAPDRAPVPGADDLMSDEPSWMQESAPLPTRQPKETPVAETPAPTEDFDLDVASGSFDPATPAESAWDPGNEDDSDDGSGKKGGGFWGKLFGRGKKEEFEPSLEPVAERYPFEAPADPADFAAEEAQPATAHAPGSFPEPEPSYDEETPAAATAAHEPPSYEEPAAYEPAAHEPPSYEEPAAHEPMTYEPAADQYGTPAPDPVAAWEKSHRVDSDHGVPPRFAEDSGPSTPVYDLDEDEPRPGAGRRMARVDIPATGDSDRGPVHLEKTVRVPIRLSPEEAARGATIRLVIELQVESGSRSDSEAA